jgi:hypothetical protein
MYIDFIVKVDASDRVAFDRYNPIQAVQANSPKQCPRPPFALDKAFRKAFREAVANYGHKRIEGVDSLRPPKGLLDGIFKKMQAAT